MTEQTFDAAPDEAAAATKPEADAKEHMDRLRERAKLMGLTVSPNIGAAKLAEKIAEKLAENDEGDNEASDGTEVPTSSKPTDIAVDPYQAANQLIRCRIQCVNPIKQSLAGEIHTVGNALGSIKQYVPYGEGSEEGWHLRKMIFDHLKEKVYLQTKTVKHPNGREHVKTAWVKEFVLEVLEPLTQAELDQLATAQLAQGLVENPDALSV